MVPLPTGTVTFLFTDIEGSTKLWESVPEKMKVALQRHHEILNSAIESQGGVVFQIIGDAFCAAFHTAPSAVSAALKAQENLFNQNWDLPSPLRVRMGIHTGIAESASSESATGGYTSNQTLNRVARIMSAGHGGQILLSLATEELTRDSLPANTELHDMGERHLRDLIRPERIFQLNTKGLPSDFPALKTLDFYRHNLPVQLTSFIGREKESAELEQSLTEHRLVTLTGSGGTGKTRLSLQVAANLLDHFPDGVWFVELAPLTNPDLIPQTILSTMGIQEQSGRTPLQLLEEYLHERKTLIVLDNCEHLIDASAKVANTLLNAASSLKILASSREALGVKGELSYPVPSLSLPDPKHLPAIEQLSQFEAVHLFIDRALLVAPHFIVDKDNAPFIAQICYRLDGIPLAIELAAARVRSMPVDKIAGRLDDRFHLLTGGSRTALPRQQTLRATIDWSYDLLSKLQRMLFCRLAVFMGGWRLESAEEICTGDGIASDNIDDLLGHLVDKSLVELEENGRYRMLETVRQYARDRLFESGEGEALRNQHLEWHVKLTERAAPEFHKHRQLEWLNCIEEEYENLRTAFEWAIESKNADAALRISGALNNFWSMCGRVNDARSWSERALELADNFEHLQESKWRAAALSCLGGILIDIGDFSDETAQRMLTDALAIYRKWDHKAGIATCLAELAIEQSSIGEQNKACELIDEALLVARKTSDAFRIGTILHLKAIMLPNEAYSVSLSLMKESINNLKATGDRWQLASTMQDMATYLLFAGEITEAENLYREAMAHFSDLKIPYGVADCVSRLGFLEHERGRYAAAVQSYQHALQIYQDTGYKNGVGISLYRLGNIEFVQLHLDQAFEYFEDCRDILMSLEDKQMLAILDACIGKLFLIQNKEFAAEQILKQSLALLKVPNSNAYHALSGLGELSRRRGKFEEALQYYRKGIKALGKFDRTFFIAYVLDGVAKTYSDLNKSDLSLVLFAAIDSMRLQWNCVIHPVFRGEYDKYITLLREKLGDTAFDKIWVEGKSMSIEEAIAFALGESND